MQGAARRQHDGDPSSWLRTVKLAGSAARFGLSTEHAQPGGARVIEADAQGAAPVLQRLAGAVHDGVPPLEALPRSQGGRREADAPQRGRPDRVRILHPA